MAALAIESVRPRWAVTGALMLRVSGPDNAARADRLAEKLGEALAPRGVRVARPTKSAELRVCGPDDSVTREEVTGALAQAGGCSEGDIRTGEVRRSSSGPGAVWARCPLPAARKLEAVGRIVVGWVSARIEVLAQRPLQCYRCLETGHVRQRNTSAVDRSGACYRCGAEGHHASHCAAAPNCPLCADMGRPAAHRMGGKQCTPPSRRGQRRGAPGPLPAPVRVAPAASAEAPADLAATAATAAKKGSEAAAALMSAMEVDIGPAAVLTEVPPGGGEEAIN